jgi:glucose-6-phosphate isomerase
MNDIVLAGSIAAVTIVVLTVGRYRLRTGKWGRRRILIALLAIIASCMAPMVAMQLGIPAIDAPVALAIGVGGSGVIALTAIEALSHSPRRLDSRK